MGVKDLWSILEPTLERKTLNDLNGLVVAVDLSIWICQLQAAVQNPIVVKPHLRNLFFRISAMLRHNILPIFVVEGEAPKIKQHTIKSRINSRCGRNKQVFDKEKCDKIVKRGRFDSCLKECCELIEFLGLPFVESDGEAEALCAALNYLGVVDAVLTNDGDALLYGASCVYRNFNIDGKIPSFDCYTIKAIEKHLNLNRQKLIGLALLTGCDYCPQGVPGVGKESALKFIETIEEIDILEKFKSWSLNDNCTNCSKWECFVKSRALKLDKFPDEDVVNEFLRPRNIPKDLTREKIVWNQPAFVPLQVVTMKEMEYFSKKLEWPTEYIIAKVVPLITLWILQTNNKILNQNETIKPQKVIKERVKDKIPVYEVQWEKLTSDIWTEQKFYITLERQDLVNETFPKLVEDFQTSVKEIALTKKKRGGRSKKNAVQVVAEETNWNNSLVLFVDDNDELFNNNFVDNMEELFNNSIDAEDDKENAEIDSLANQLQKVALVTDEHESAVSTSPESTKIDTDEILNADSPLPLAKRLQLLSNCKNGILLKNS